MLKFEIDNDGSVKLQYTPPNKFATNELEPRGTSPQSSETEKFEIAIGNGTIALDDASAIEKKENAASTTTRENAASPTKENAASTTTKEHAASTTTKENAASTTTKENAASTTTKENAASTTKNDSAVVVSREIFTAAGKTKVHVVESYVEGEGCSCGPQAVNLFPSVRDVEGSQFSVLFAVKTGKRTWGTVLASVASGKVLVERRWKSSWGTKRKSMITPFYSSLFKSLWRKSGLQMFTAIFECTCK